MKNISYEKTLKKIGAASKEFFANTEFEGHSDIVRNIILSKDEKTLYSCSDDKTIIQWDTLNKTKLH